MKQKSSITVVIPSWNSSRQLKDNLPWVIRAAAQAKAAIVIVDDASTDDSVSVISQDWQYPINLITHTINHGYGSSVNDGVQAAQTDLIVLLNTDVKPELNCFVNARKYFDQSDLFAVTFNSQEGYMGCYFDRGLFHHCRVNNHKDNPTNPSLWASGGQAMFDRDKWLKLGGMDRLYEPFYWEDTDLGYNGWKYGWQIIWAADCRCLHNHQQSVIAGSFAKSQIMQIAQRNQFLFIWKNIRDPKYLIPHLLFLPYYLLKYPRVVLSAFTRLAKALKSRNNLSSGYLISDRDILNIWSDSK